MKQTLLILILLVATSITSLHAAVPITENISMDAEFRPRLELDNRDFNSGTGFDAYTTLRTRLGIKIDKVIENTAFYLQIADSRMMGFNNPYLTGTSPGPNGFDNNLGVTKVYLETRDFVKSGTMFRIGRFDNDQRREFVLGPGNWSYTGPRTYDGWKLGLEKEAWEAHLWSFFGAKGDRHWYPRSDDPAKSPNPDEDYKRDHSLTGWDLAFWKKQIGVMTYLELDQKPVLVTLTNERNVAVSCWTVAGNLKMRPPQKTAGLWIDGDLALQTGSMGLAYGQADIMAWMLAGDVVYHLEDALNLWGGLGFHFTSGDDAADTLEVGWFQDMYSSGHQTFGHMDYFTTALANKSKAERVASRMDKANGMRDLILRGGLAPVKDVTVGVDIHHFMVGEAYPSAVDGEDANTLGQEIDILAGWQARKGLTAQLGVDFFLPNEDWKGEDAKMATFFYLTLAAKI